MRVSMGSAESVRRSSVTNTDLRGNHFFKISQDVLKADNQGWMSSDGSMLQQRLQNEDEEKKESLDDETVAETPDDRSEALKLYEAVRKGEESPIKNLRAASKVPYGHLAKDGVIVYNGVLFTCDEKTNSICLGDMTDKKQVINIPLSGGGQLKVNRANIGDLSKAIGMFSPEDVKLILRAIHLDTKLQSVQKEIEDMEASVGEQVSSNETEENPAQDDEDDEAAAV